MITKDITTGNYIVKEYTQPFGIPYTKVYVKGTLMWDYINKLKG